MCTDLHLIAEEFRRVCRSPHPARASLGTEHLLLAPPVEERNLSDFEEISACFSVIYLGENGMRVISMHVSPLLRETALHKCSI